MVARRHVRALAPPWMCTAGCCRGTHPMRGPGMKSRTWRCAMQQPRSGPAARRHSHPGGRARGVEHGGAEYLRRADHQPDRCAQSRLPPHQSGREQYTGAVPAADRGCAGSSSSSPMSIRTALPPPESPAGKRPLLRSAPTMRSSLRQLAARTLGRRTAISTCGSASSAGGLLGYAQFPGGPAATDGVVILHSAFGTIGHRRAAVPSRPHRDPRNRPLAEPQSHLGR